MTRRIGLTLVGTMIALLSLAGAASAQQYPPEAGALQTNKSEARPGEDVTLSGSGCGPNTTVTVSFDNQVLGTTQSRADGTFTITVAVPSNATPGSHTFSSTCVAGNGATRRLTATVNVLGGAAAAPGGVLPATGTGLTTPLAASAALLIAAGGVAVMATRRRERSQSDVRVASST